MKKKDKKKIILKCTCALCSCFLIAMVYIHRRVIVAAIKGEEIPKAPKGCPAHKGD